MTPDVKLKIEEVKGWIDARLPSSVTNLIDLALMNSATLNTEGVNKVQNQLADTFAALGLSVKLHQQVSRGPILVARSRASSENGDIALVGHADVSQQDPQRDPVVSMEGDILKGAGVYDMKGGISVMIDALTALHQMGKLDAYPLRVVINSAEESPTPRVIESMKTLLRGCEAALVFEFGRQGDHIVVERKGIVQAAYHVTGKGRHARLAFTSDGNAVEQVGKLIDDIGLLRDEQRGISTNPAKIWGGNEANTVPADAHVLFEARFNAVGDYGRIVEHLEGLAMPRIRGTSIELEIKDSLPPMERTSQTNWLFDVWKKAGMKAGLSFEMSPRVGGVSDGNVAASLGIPTLDGLGPRGGGEHEETEHVLISSLPPKTLNLIHFLLEYEEEKAREAGRKWLQENR